MTNLFVLSTQSEEKLLEGLSIMEEKLPLSTFKAIFEKLAAGPGGGKNEAFNFFLANNLVYLRGIFSVTDEESLRTPVNLYRKERGLEKIEYRHLEKYSTALNIPIQCFLMGIKNVYDENEITGNFVLPKEDLSKNLKYSKDNFKYSDVFAELNKEFKKDHPVLLSFLLKKIGAKINFFRKFRKKKLSDIVGEGADIVWKLENGRIYRPGDIFLNHIGSSINVSIINFFEGITDDIPLEIKVPSMILAAADEKEIRRITRVVDNKLARFKDVKTCLEEKILDEPMVEENPLAQNIFGRRKVFKTISKEVEKVQVVSNKEKKVCKSEFFDSLPMFTALREIYESVAQTSKEKKFIQDCMAEYLKNF